jgi:hypothetical protein
MNLEDLTDEELAAFDAVLLQHIRTHPNETPEEILAHFGIPFDRAIWNETMEHHPRAVARLQHSPNPNDRKNWRPRHDG